MRIDSHHHLWNYSQSEYPWIDDSKALLRRDFTPDDLQQVSHDCGITGTIAVQARQHLEETEWLLDQADWSSLICAVVGWAPLASPEIGAILERFAQSTKLRGMRHVVQDEPGDTFFQNEGFQNGIRELTARNLIYDILIYANQLSWTTPFVDQHPNQTFVLDHIAKPTIQQNLLDLNWKRDVCDLAKRGNVACKFSGVVTEVQGDQWTIDTIRPYWETAWEAFGASRMMFGSDWPVCLLRSEYAAWVAAVEELASELSDSEQRAFWSENAIRWYKLPLEPQP